MDQGNFWNSMLVHPADAQNLPDYLLSPIDSDMISVNIAAEDNSALNIWSSNEPSSSGHSQSQGNLEDTKMAEDNSSFGIWTSNGPSSDSPSVGQNDEENLLSLEDVDMNLSSAQFDDGQPYSLSRFSIVNNAQQNNAAFDSIGGGATGSRFSSHTYFPNSLERECYPSSNPHASSSGVVGFKRKNSEGFPGQSSSSGSANLTQAGIKNSVASVSNDVSAGINISSPSSNLSVSSTSSEHLNSRLSTVIRGNVESSHRNFQHRFNPAHQNDIYPPNLYSLRDIVHNSGIWLPNEPPSHSIPPNHRVEPREATYRSGFQQLPQNANIYPRNVSLPSTANPAQTMRNVREDTVTRNSPQSNLLEQSLLFQRNEVRNLVQDSASWNIANRAGTAAVGPTLRAGTSSPRNSPIEPMWVPNQNSSTRLSRSLLDAGQTTSLASRSSSGSGVQGSNVPFRRSSQPSTSVETGHLSGSLTSLSRGNQQSRLRAFLMDRQNDGIPLSLRSVAAREGRNRMILEIRNALDLMHRGGNLQSEDVFVLDHPVFQRVADLHDRHRDMRLNVDNMSYEELLALEERIGNVNTGLSEETILKCLKKQKHLLVNMREMVEHEPCCICQEEYAEGEDLGMLDCGHDFHADCIKQWLMHKNLCPICKTTALKT